MNKLSNRCLENVTGICNLTQEIKKSDLLRIQNKGLHYVIKKNCTIFVASKYKGGPKIASQPASQTVWL